MALLVVAEWLACIWFFVQRRFTAGGIQNAWVCTANVDLEPGIILPADGIYATWTQADGKTYPSATNIGFRPTFGSSGRQVETHIFGYSGDLYNARIRVAFARKLRDEMKFNGVDALVKQLHEDVAQAKVVLAEDDAKRPPGW